MINKDGGTQRPSIAVGQTGESSKSMLSRNSLNSRSVARYKLEGEVLQLVQFA